MFSSMGVLLLHNAKNLFALLNMKLQMLFALSLLGNGFWRYAYGSLL